HVGAALDRHRLRPLRLDRQRLVEAAGAQNLHVEEPTSTSKVVCMPDLARRLAVARGDEPAELVVRGGRVFSAFTREWLEGDVAVVDGYVAGLGGYQGAGGGRARGPARAARVRGRAL